MFSRAMCLALLAAASCRDSFAQTAVKLLNPDKIYRPGQVIHLESVSNNAEDCDRMLTLESASSDLRSAIRGSVLVGKGEADLRFGIRIPLDAIPGKYEPFMGVLTTCPPGRMARERITVQGAITVEDAQR